MCKQTGFLYLKMYFLKYYYPPIVFFCKTDYNKIKFLFLYFNFFRLQLRLVQFLNRTHSRRLHDIQRAGTICRRNWIVSIATSHLWNQSRCRPHHPQRPDATAPTAAAIFASATAGFCSRVDKEEEKGYCENLIIVEFYHFQKCSIACAK